MDKPTKGIPTVYKGVQFRSRLEAKWAAMFDLLEWPWQYEPFDLEGWIPDFLLTGQEKILVEVKPVTDLPHETKDEIYRTSWDGNVLIVGCVLGFDYGGFYDDDDPDFGWYREGRDVLWDAAAFYGTPDRIGFSGFHMVWHDRIFSRPEFPSAKHGWGNGIGARVLELWNRAGNLTQWRGKQSIVRS